MYRATFSSDLRKPCCKLVKACLQIQITVLLLRKFIITSYKQNKNIHLLIWTKFEEHCKPKANELHTHYDLLKQLKQGDKSCDEYYALLQNQLALCQYPPKTQNIL